MEATGPKRSAGEAQSILGTVKHVKSSTKSRTAAVRGSIPKTAIMKRMASMESLTPSIPMSVPSTIASVTSLVLISSSVELPVLQKFLYPKDFMVPNEPESLLLAISETPLGSEVGWVTDCSCFWEIYLFSIFDNLQGGVLTSCTICGGTF